MIKIDLTTHEAIGPSRTDMECAAEDAHMPGFVGTSNEDNLAIQRRTWLELEGDGHAAPLRCGFGQATGACAMSGDISARTQAQLLHVSDMMSLPHLRLPQCVEALNAILHAMLER